MNKFIIVIPVYNAQPYIVKCIESVLSQNYKNYEIVVVNDGSDDRTSFWAKKYPVLVLDVEPHTGSPVHSTKLGIEHCSTDGEDIILVLDGDDWLSNRRVLSYLNKIYKEDVWLTYGQFKTLSGKHKRFSKPVEDTQKYRKSGEWHTSAPRTFKRWLWDKIDPEDFKYYDKWLIRGSDRAYLYPMIEMAGKHIRCLDRVLYIYNDLNPLCSSAVRPGGCIERAEYLMNKKEYKEL